MRKMLSSKKSKTMLWKPTTKQMESVFHHATQSSLDLLSISQCSTTKWWRTTLKHANLLTKHFRTLSIKSTNSRKTTSVMPRALLNSSRKTWLSGRKKKRAMTMKLTTCELVILWDGRESTLHSPFRLYTLWCFCIKNSILQLIIWAVICPCFSLCMF